VFWLVSVKKEENIKASECLWLWPRMGSDDEYGLRLARRLKRRSIANHTFAKKARNNSFGTEDVPIDLDEHDADADDDSRCTNDGHNDVNCAKKTKNNSFRMEDVPVGLDEHNNDADDNARCLNDGHDDVNYANKTKNNSFRMEDVPVGLDEHDNDADDNARCSNDGDDAVNYAKKTKNNSFRMKNVPVGLDEHDNDADDNARCSNDGHGGVRIEKNNEKVADQQHNMCLDDDVVDPDYKTFLENVREDNQSYVLEVVISNGMSVLIKYERQEGLSDGLKLDRWKTLNSCPRRESTETATTLRANSKSKIQSLNDLGNVSGVERTGKTEARITLRNASKRGKTASPHVLSGGSSIEKSKINENAKNLSASKTKKTVTPNVLRGKTRTSRILSNSQREKDENLNILSNISSTKKTGEQRTLTNVSRRESTEAPETLRGVRGKESKNSMRDVKEENEYPLSGGTNGYLYKRSGTTSCKVLHPTMRECNREVESDMIDENYQEFLNCLKVDGGNFVFTPESGIPVRYEADARSSDDPEIITTDKNPFCDGYRTPFISSKCDPIVCISMPESGIPVRDEADAESADDPEIIAMDKNPFCDGYRTPFISSKCDSIVCISSSCNFGSFCLFSAWSFKFYMLPTFEIGSVLVVCTFQIKRSI
jgi:hypothetical protein